MKKLKTFLFVFLTTIACGCTPKPHDEVLVDQLADNYIKELRQKEGFALIGTGASMMGKVKKLNFLFSTNKKLSLENARQLLVRCTEKYLCLVNSDEEIRPYLDSFPVKADGIELSIWVDKDPLYKVDPNFIQSVLLKERTVCYRKYDPSIGRVTRFYGEPYEEALKKSCSYGQ